MSGCGVDWQAQGLALPEETYWDRARQTEYIHQYIVRRAMTATSDDLQLMTEATLAWNERFESEDDP